MFMQMLIELTSLPSDVVMDYFAITNETYFYFSSHNISTIHFILNPKLIIIIISIYL